MKKLWMAVALTFGVAVAGPKGVVMDFGALDTIEALGAEASVLALPKGNTPEYLAKFNTDSYDSSGTMKEPDMALIREKSPDFIVISGRQGAFLEELSEIAPVINFSVEGEYLTSTKQNILAVGKAVEKEPEALEAWNRLEEKINAAQETARASGKSAVVILHNDGKFWASNSNGYANFIHHVAGVKKADTDTQEKGLSATSAYLELKNPDLIFIVDRSAAIGQTPMDPHHFNKAEFAAVNAVKEGKVIYLTPKLWYLSGQGLQSIERQLDEVLDAL